MMAPLRNVASGFNRLPRARPAPSHPYYSELMTGGLRRVEWTQRDREVASEHCFDKSGWTDLPDNAAKLSTDNPA